MQMRNGRIARIEQMLSERSSNGMGSSIGRRIGEEGDDAQELSATDFSD